MTQVDGKAKDRVNLAIGIFVSIVAFILYLKTLAPSISFWDCGEFVAASVTFGIPHPPGSPVFILFGKIFSSIPFANDMAYRVNMISAISSAASVLVAYFIITRIISYWHTGSEDIWQRLGKYIGGIVGALCMGFNRTFWTNAVEAEVYGLTMLVFLTIIYLFIVWYSKHESTSTDNILILIFYLAAIGLGIHMSAFLVMPAGFIFMALVDRRLRTDIRFWITIAVISLVMIVKIEYFLYGTALWMIISLIGVLNSRKKRMWRLSMAIAFVSLLGFSVQLYVPIRSTFEPIMDENNPDNWERFTSFLDREQYGQENMFTRMFHRRGELAHQFGDFPRMGFWRFFSEQYSNTGWAFFWFLLLGFYGMYAAIRKNLSVGSFMLLLVLAGTVGLTLYMNFADGTQINPTTMLERLEVRDRDYFWTPGFAMFGICLGLGAAALYYAVRRKLSESLNHNSAGIKAVSLAMCLFILLPAVTVAHNYRACDRTLDTLPFDYAYNVLNSCENDAILFTAGDNDTFPLWALQYGLGIRPDVRIVNLSLLDTDWYAIQMKNNMNVPISLTDEQIMTEPTMIQGIQIPLPKVPFYDPIRKQKRLLRSFMNSDGHIVRVAHQLIENILLNNKWKCPIYFANMPPAEVAFNLREYCEKVGIIYHITEEKKNGAINADESFRLFTDVYQFRNLDNPKYYRDETGTMMALGAGQKYLDLYNRLADIGDSARALIVFRDLGEKIPEIWEHALMHATVDSLYGIEGKTRQEYGEDYLSFVDALLENAPDNFYYLQYKGVILQALDRKQEGLEAFEEAFRRQPTSMMTYRSLVTAYLAMGMVQEAVRISKKFHHLNPADQTSKRLLDAYSTQQSSALP